MLKTSLRPAPPCRRCRPGCPAPRRRARPGGGRSQRADRGAGRHRAATSSCDKETFLFYVSTKPGDRYDERRLKDDFRRLWDTGFLEDLRPRRARRADGQDRHLRGRRSASASRSSTTAAARPSPPPPSRTSSRRRRPSLTHRHLLRPRQGAPGGGDHPRDAGREGPALRAPSSTTPSRWAARACRSPSSSTTGPRPRSSQIEFDGQHGLLRRQAARADEEDQADGLLEPVLARAARPPTPRRSGRTPRRATGAGWRTST